MRRPAVLVVEDDPLLRLSAMDMVQEAGFDALEAANADEAITILETRADIRAVFTDINMPGTMDGVKLARAVRDRWPPIALIVTSGLGLGNAAIPPGAMFLHKPYLPEQVTSALRRLIR